MKQEGNTVSMIQGDMWQRRIKHDFLTFWRVDQTLIKVDTMLD
jgi:hypothetical protein